MQAEAKAITATRIAMQQLDAINNPNGSVVRPNNVATQDFGQTQEVPAQQATSAATDFQSAMDELNSLERANYDFQPQRRIEDPRNIEAQSSVTGTLPTTGTAQTEVQPTSEQATGTVDTKLPEPSTQEYDLVFDENGVGSYVPKVAQAERVASRSVSEDVATEAQTSTTSNPKGNEQQVTNDRKVNTKGDVRFGSVADAGVLEIKPTTITFRKQQDGAYVSQSNSMDFNGISVADPDAQMKPWLDEGK